MDSFIGEIKIFCGDYAPLGWSFCDGTLLTIKDNEALYGLIGTAYGGDGVTTFALPDLRGRVPVHQGRTFPIAQQGGEEEVMLVEANYGAHSHVFNATTKLADQPAPPGNTPAQSGTVQLWTQSDADVAMDPGAVRPVTRDGQPHENIPPFLAINYIIALQGVFPIKD